MVIRRKPWKSSRGWRKRSNSQEEIWKKWFPCMRSYLKRKSRWAKGKTALLFWIVLWCSAFGPLFVIFGCGCCIKVGLSTPWAEYLDKFQVPQTCFVVCRIADRERQLSILYQKQGRRTQFDDKASRDQWLQNQIDDTKQGILDIKEQVSVWSHILTIEEFTVSIENAVFLTHIFSVTIRFVLCFLHVFFWAQLWDCNLK